MSQDAEKKQPSQRHSPTRDSRGRDKSGHGEKPTNQETLTDWRQQRNGQVRTQKETDGARGTHLLETAEGWTSHDIGRNQWSQGYLLAGDHRGEDKSGHRKKLTEPEALTYWGPQKEG